MTIITKGLTLLVAIIALIRTFLDPLKRREAFELVLDKQAKKALQAAETIIHGMDSYLAEQISLKQFKYIFRKHRRRFFDND